MTFLHIFITFSFFSVYLYISCLFLPYIFISNNNINDSSLVAIVSVYKVCTYAVNISWTRCGRFVAQESVAQLISDGCVRIRMRMRGMLISVCSLRCLPQRRQHTALNNRLVFWLTLFCLSNSCWRVLLIFFCADVHSCAQVRTRVCFMRLLDYLHVEPHITAIPVDGSLPRE